MRLQARGDEFAARGSVRFKPPHHRFEAQGIGACSGLHRPGPFRHGVLYSLTNFREALGDQLISSLGGVLVEKGGVGSRVTQTGLQVCESCALLRSHDSACVAKVVEAEIPSASDLGCLLEVPGDCGATAGA